MPRIYIDENLQYSPQDMNRRRNTLEAARLMVNAALTAPQGGGVPQVEAEIVYGQEEQEALAREMEKLAYERDKKLLRRIFLTESVMARQADAVIFLGNYRASDDPFDVNCGGCGGQPSCAFLYERKKLTAHLIDLTDRRTNRFINGPLCIVRVTDLGFAIGSALQMANRLMVDARAFFTMGLAGQRLGYCRNSALVAGVPVATMSKNPFVDVCPDYHMMAREKIQTNVRQYLTFMRQIGPDYRTSEVKRADPREEERIKSYMDWMDVMRERFLKFKDRSKSSETTQDVQDVEEEE
jgi:uncharacterized ferredoxin-like protein